MISYAPIRENSGSSHGKEDRPHGRSKKICPSGCIRSKYREVASAVKKEGHLESPRQFISEGEHQSQQERISPLPEIGVRDPEQK